MNDSLLTDFWQNNNPILQRFTSENIKIEPQAVEDEFVPAPPVGSPPAHLPQPILKNPEKFLVNQLIYFHYNINEHWMYVSPCSFPSHTQPPTNTQLPTSQWNPFQKSVPQLTYLRIWMMRKWKWITVAQSTWYIQ